MVALSRAVSVALLVSGALLAAVALAALFLRGRTRERGPDIPAAMRPGPADAALETPLLQKLQGWGVLLVAFFVVWVPFVWLSEASINLDQEQDLTTESIERGSRAVLPFSEENQLGVGCVRCHGPELRGGVIAAGENPDGTPAYAYPPDLTDVCGGPNTGHGAIKSVEDIRTTIEQGRGAMPSWSIRYEGALDDQQIGDLVQYLIALSSENVPIEQNVCLNQDAADAAATPSAAASGTATAGGTASESPAAAASESPAAPESPVASEAPAA
jgi:mono/diheme cytochrome c family protein